MTGFVNVLSNASEFYKGFFLLDELLCATLNLLIQFQDLISQGNGAFANPKQLIDGFDELLMIRVTLALYLGFSRRSKIGQLP